MAREGWKYSWFWESRWSNANNQSFSINRSRASKNMLFALSSHMLLSLGNWPEMVLTWEECNLDQIVSFSLEKRVERVIKIPREQTFLSVKIIAMWLWSYVFSTHNIIADQHCPLRLEIREAFLWRLCLRYLRVTFRKLQKKKMFTTYTNILN